MASSPSRRPSVLVEVVGLLLALALFTRLHAAAGHDAAAATANARALQSLERGLRIDVEGSANGWLTGHPSLVQPAVHVYRWYYAVVVGVLAWVLLRRPGTYPRVRRALLAMAALALLVFWALPVSPPRLAQPGVVDVVAEHDFVAGGASRALGNGQDHYSAMPSLHVGWAAWCAYAVWSALRATHPRLALVAWVFPVLMAADVLTTGNHYVLDVVGSAVLLLAAVAVASACGRLAARWRRSRTG